VISISPGTSESGAARRAVGCPHHRCPLYQHLRIAIATSPFVTRTQAYGKQRDRIDSKALTKAFSTVIFSYAELSMSHVLRMRQRCSCAPSVRRSEAMFCKLSCVYLAVFGES
jgi:hypothetical protein